VKEHLYAEEAQMDRVSDIVLKRGGAFLSSESPAHLGPSFTRHGARALLVAFQSSLARLHKRSIFFNRITTMRNALTTLVLIAAIDLQADETQDKPKQQSPVGEYQRLVRDFMKSREEFSKAYSEAKTEDEKKRVLNQLGGRASPQMHANGFLTLVQMYPKDPVALDAFRWLLANDRANQPTEQAAIIIAQEQIDGEGIAAVCKALWYYPCQAGENLLRAALEKNPRREVQGLARYSLAQCLKEQERLGTALKEIEKLLEQVLERYAEVKHPSGLGTLGEAATADLFETRNLAVGKVAPEIVGEDIDGKPMKLSDYRGKVVLLDFWGHW
jgi:hypothetical protein